MSKIDTFIDWQRKQRERYGKFSEKHPVWSSIMGLLTVVFGIVCALIGSSQVVGPVDAKRIYEDLVSGLPPFIKEQITPNFILGLAVPSILAGGGMIFSVFAGLIFDVPPPLPPPPQNEISLYNLLMESQIKVINLEVENEALLKRKDEYKLAYLNQQAWRRVILRGMFLVVAFAMASLTASLIYPWDGHENGSSLYFVEEMFQFYHGGER